MMNDRLEKDSQSIFQEDERAILERIEQLTQTELVDLCKHSNIIINNNYCNNDNDNNTTTNHPQDVMIKEILKYHQCQTKYENDRKNNKQLDSSSTNNINNSDDEQRIYTRDELKRMYRFKLIEICNHYGIETDYSGNCINSGQLDKVHKMMTIESIIRSILIHQSINIKPKNDDYKSYSLPWSTITRILEYAWNNARYCTCIYPQKLKDTIIRDDLLYDTPDRFSLLKCHVEISTRILLERVRERNQQCPQHAMFYREDNTNFKRLPFIRIGFDRIYESFYNQDQMTWRLSLMTISKSTFHHLSLNCASNLSLFYLPTSTTNNNDIEEEVEFWNHLNQEYNPIKTAKNLLIVGKVPTLSESLPLWFINNLEKVKVEKGSYQESSNNFIDFVNLSKNMKTIHYYYYHDSINVLCGAFKNLNSINYPTSASSTSSTRLIELLDRPMKKLIIPEPYLLLQLKEIVRESLEVISVNDYFYSNLLDIYQKQNQQQQEEEDEHQRVEQQLLFQKYFPKVRHIKLPTIIGDTGELNPILPSSTKTVTIDFNRSDINPIIIPHLDKNVTTLRLFYFDYFKSIDRLDLKYTSIQRLVIGDIFDHLADDESNTMMDMGFEYLCSKLKMELRKFIFIKDNQKNVENNNNYSNKIQENNNDNDNMRLDIDQDAPTNNPQLPKFIIYNIIRLAWNEIGRCQCFTYLLQNQLVDKINSSQYIEMMKQCTTHGWNFNDSNCVRIDDDGDKHDDFLMSLFPYPIVDANTTWVYKTRLKYLSVLSKDIRRFIFKQLFCSFVLKSQPITLYNGDYLNIKKLISWELYDCLENTLEYYSWSETILLNGFKKSCIKSFLGKMNHLQSLDISMAPIEDEKDVISILKELKHHQLRKLILPSVIDNSILFLSNNLTSLQKKSLVQLAVDDILDVSLLKQFPNVTHLEILCIEWIDPNNIHNSKDERRNNNPPTLPSTINKITSFLHPLTMQQLIKSNVSIKTYRDRYSEEPKDTNSIDSMLSIKHITRYITNLQFNDEKGEIVNQLKKYFINNNNNNDDNNNDNNNNTYTPTIDIDIRSQMSCYYRICLTKRY